MGQNQPPSNYASFDNSSTRKTSGGVAGKHNYTVLSNDKN